MQYDICLKTTSEAALVAALEPFGLTSQGEDGNTVLATASHNHALAYAGRVVQTPAEIDQEGRVITEATYWPGEYAILRAEAAILDRVAGAAMAGVEVLDAPPVGCPTFGGWRARPAGPTIDDLKAAACDRINTECARRRAAGVAVTFPDGTGVVQTRNDVDLVNVIGVSAAGLAATVAGTMPDLYFRDEANTNHALLPTQAVDFGAQVMTRLQAITRVAHDAKDAINASGVTTSAQVAAIESAIVWPEN